MAVVIKAPTGDYRGDIGGVVFRGGEATADPIRDRAVIAYCRRTPGYIVTESAPPAEEPVESQAPEEIEQAALPAEDKPRGRGGKVAR